MSESQGSHVLAVAVGAVRDLMEKRLQLRGGADDAALQTGLEELHVLWDELQEQSELLARERQRFEDLFQFLPEACLLTDVAGHIREANRATAELLRWPAELLARKPLTVFLAAESRDTLRTQLVELHAADYLGARSWHGVVLPRDAEPLPAQLAVRAINPPHPSDLCWLIRPTS